MATEGDARFGGARRRRGRRRWIWVTVAVVVVLWVGSVGVMLVKARSDVNRGVDRLQSTQARLTPDAVARGAGRSDLQAAGRDFASAHDLVDNPLVAPFKIIPIVGRQVKSVASLTDAATRVVSIGDDAIAQVQRKLDQKPKTGPERIQLLDDLHTIASSALGKIRKVDLGPADSLVGPVKDARKKFVDKLHDATDALANADALAAGLSKLLKGPSKYLVLAANNAEMRAGGGMLLSAGILTVEDGRLTLGDMNSTSDLRLPAGAVPVPGALGALWGFTRPTEEWRNLATTPRFGTTGPLAAQMWKALTGESVDGVLALDPLMLRALLAAEGPVEVDGVELNADNVVDFILHDQYKDTTTDPQNGARRDRLSAIAHAAIDALDQRDWEPSTLLKELSAAVEGRHFLAWSSDPLEEKAWVGAGMAGRLSTDSLLVAVLNFGGNKLDRFLSIDADLSTRDAGDGSLVTLELKLHNGAPLFDVPYVIGPYPGTGNEAGEYIGQVAVSFPAVAGKPHLQGAGPLSVAGNDGPTQVVAAQVDLKRGEDKTVTLTFQLPKGYTELEIEPSARVPPVQWHFRGLGWDDSAPRSVKW